MAWACSRQVGEVGGCGIEVEVEIEGDCYVGSLGEGGGGFWCWVRVRMGGRVALALFLVLERYLLAGLRGFLRLGCPEGF